VPILGLLRMLFRYSYGDTKLGKGRNAIEQLLTDNPELAEKLEIKIQAEVTSDKLQEK